MPGTISRKKETIQRKIIAIDGLAEIELLILSLVPPPGSYGVSRLNMFDCSLFNSSIKLLD